MFILLKDTILVTHGRKTAGDMFVDIIEIMYKIQ